MSVINQSPNAAPSAEQPVISLKHELERSRSPWAEAAWRFSRNRAAVLGLIVIFVCILAAVFAPNLSSYTYDEQNYLAVNTAPQWTHRHLPQDEARRRRHGLRAHR